MKNFTTTSEIQDQSPIVRLFSAPFILGIMLFFINNEADLQYNVPAGEVIYFVAIIGTLLVQRSIMVLPGFSVALWAALFAILWSTGAQYYHEGSGGATRTFVKLLVLYGMLAGYALVPDKRGLFTLAIGFLAGYLAHYISSVFTMFLTMPVSSYYLLKYILPNIVLLFMVAFFMRRFLSKSILIYFSLGVIFCIGTLVFASSRTSLLAIPTCLLFFIMAELLRFPRWLLITFGIMIPFIPIVIVGYYYSESNLLDIGKWLYEAEVASLSNVERVLMIHASITAFLQEPFVGIGLEEFLKIFGPYYMMLTKQSFVAAESPHNFYLEQLVPYGGPALFFMIIFYMFLFGQFFKASANIRFGRGMAAMGIGMLSLIFLVEPVAGIRRIDVAIISAICMFGYSRQLTSKA